MKTHNSSLAAKYSLMFCAILVSGAVFCYFAKYRPTAAAIQAKIAIELDDQMPSSEQKLPVAVREQLQHTMKF